MYVTYMVTYIHLSETIFADVVGRRRSNFSEEKLLRSGIC